MHPHLTTEGSAGGGARILIVEDDPNILELLTASLELNGFTAHGAADARAAVRTAGTHAPDIAMVDVTLPDRSGLKLVGDLRGLVPDLPVLFLTARDTVEDRLAGFRAGADDYVTKPFSLEEVAFRLRAILRRTGRAEDRAEPLRYADLELDEDAHEARRDGHPVRLSPTEFALLRYLLLNSGRTVTKSQILEQVWGGQTEDTRVVETYISYLRRKVDSLGRPLIQTVRGIGYSLRLTREDRR
ncbi:response regulator transcription factor [Streptomyces profundus]|uniref:response regulator transcription factor n=1 Tax=Streptomyces profundus TaxID=2867410 RepID=UPI001D169007|nr:response regulator transcription factor [Streptomyces sp. MA3_2.13]UED87476.1 response regulator transcription factor [Streptomyces sp. MA3_2.13]